MSEFVSFAQNGEDVVLRRALHGIDRGTYLDIGANDPTDASASRAFYDIGWDGLAVEPNADYAARFRSARPRDVLFEGAVTDSQEHTLTLHQIEGTGLSTLVDRIGSRHAESGMRVVDVVVQVRGLSSLLDETGIGDREIHFAMIDVEGAEESVIRSLDLVRHRPWILVVEATEPNSTTPSHHGWEPLLLNAGYKFCLFDGVSRFYVDAVHHADIEPLLSYPAGFFDTYRTREQVRLDGELRSLNGEVARLRDENARSAALRAQLEEVYASTSWKATAPLRAVGSLINWRGMTGQHRSPVEKS